MWLDSYSESPDHSHFIRVRKITMPQDAGYIYGALIGLTASHFSSVLTGTRVPLIQAIRESSNQSFVRARALPGYHLECGKARLFENLCRLTHHPHSDGSRL
jgi:hypothetical protein